MILMMGYRGDFYLIRNGSCHRWAFNYKVEQSSLFIIVIIIVFIITIIVAEQNSHFINTIIAIIIIAYSFCLALICCCFCYPSFVLKRNLHLRITVETAAMIFTLIIYHLPMSILTLSLNHKLLAWDSCSKACLRQTDMTQ